MASKAQELLEKRAKVWEEAKALKEKIASEERGIKPDEKEKWEKMMSKMDDLKEESDIELKYEQRQKEMAENALITGNATEVRGEPAPSEERAYQELFYSAISKGATKEELRSINNEYRLGLDYKVEKRAVTDPMSTSVPAEGGLLVPQLWGQGIDREMKTFGEIIGAARMYTTATGAPINRIYKDEFVKGGIIGENTTADKRNMEFKTKTIGAFKYTSFQIPVSYELLQDSAYNVEQEITMEVGERIGRILAEHMTTGDGLGKPEGVLPAAAASGKTTTGATISAPLLNDLEHSVDRAYRLNAKYMMHDSTILAIKNLEIGSGDSRPLWKPSVIAGQPDTINGYGYITNNEMPELTAATGAKVIAFGDFNKYELRQVGGYRLRRLNELGALEDQVIFIAYARFDAKLIIPNSIKTLAKGA